ncbi:uncharacterized protein V6R79_015212 [Siganus canaliculatus]
MQRWSGCSGSTQSRSSTPDTIIWRDGSSRPLSLNQEAGFCAAPDSPVSKPTSRPNTPSSVISPLQTPTLATDDPFTSSSSSLLTLSMHQQKDLAASSVKSSPVFSPLQAHISSPLSANSPNLVRLTSTEDEGFLENNLLSFTFPSPIPSSVCLAEEGAMSDPSCLDDDGVMEELHSPGDKEPEGGGVSAEAPNSPAARRESRGSVCYLELPWQPRQAGPADQDRRLPLASSVSDSQLGKCCRCHLDSRGLTKAQKVNDGTMTSKPELVDAAAQTMSPVGSLWGLKRNVSNTGSHSILGSPPGSRLNLKASMGSHSNLVSPSSSMFPMSSDEEAEARGGGEGGDEKEWISPSSHEVDGRRSCLKTQGEDKEEMGRRSSMKQVQWDEDGMTWDIHGASVDPEDLSMAIQKHLELKSTPRPVRRTSKKKKAPKPPVKSDAVTTPESDPPVAAVTSPTCEAEGESETPPAAAAAVADGGGDVEEKDEDKKEETGEAVHGASKAEGEKAKNEEEVEEEKKEKEVPGDEGQPKSPSRGSVQSRKRSIIRSLRRPGWCGGSRKTDD